MAKFKFTFQTFLNIKEKLEEQKKQEYGFAIAELEREKQEKIRLEIKKKECIDSFREQLNIKIKPMEIRIHNDYIELTKKRITKQKEVILQAEERAENKRLELVEAIKERKKLEKLEKNEKEVFLKEEHLTEQKIVDEIVSYRFNNRRV